MNVDGNFKRKGEFNECVMVILKANLNGGLGLTHEIDGRC
jgi:hypothetical protein